MTPKQSAFGAAAKTLIKNLEKRGMDGFYFETKEACLSFILNMLPAGSSISWGGSESVKEIGLMDALTTGDYRLIDRFAATTPEESKKLYAESVMSDYFFMSTNAVTLDGELVNVDGRGNRVACLIHGPEYVIVVAGINKLVATVEEGMHRARNFAAPPNAKRLNRQTPCFETGRCSDCLSNDCMCCHTVITRKSMTKGRIKVCLVGEVLGY